MASAWRGGGAISGGELAGTAAGTAKDSAASKARPKCRKIQFPPRQMTGPARRCNECQSARWIRASL